MAGNGSAIGRQLVGTWSGIDAGQNEWRAARESVPVYDRRETMKPARAHAVLIGCIYRRAPAFFAYKGTGEVYGVNLMCSNVRTLITNKEKRNANTIRKLSDRQRRSEKPGARLRSGDARIVQRLLPARFMAGAKILIISSASGPFARR